MSEPAGDAVAVTLVKPLPSPLIAEADIIPLLILTAFPFKSPKIKAPLALMSPLTVNSVECETKPVVGTLPTDNCPFIATLAVVKVGSGFTCPPK